jgi:hypothetical protein
MARHSLTHHRGPRRRQDLARRRGGRPWPGYPVPMGSARPAAVRTQYQAGPGHHVIVVTDLATLRGPEGGITELPLHLYWSSDDRTFDLDRPGMRRWMYQIVLRQAVRPEDLTRYLDRGTLITLWPELYLPRGVRQAWEEHHPVLRRAAAAAVVA